MNGFSQEFVAALAKWISDQSNYDFGTYDQYQDAVQDFLKEWSDGRSKCPTCGCVAYGEDT